MKVSKNRKLVFNNRKPVFQKKTGLTSLFDTSSNSELQSMHAIGWKQNKHANDRKFN